MAKSSSTADFWDRVAEQMERLNDPVKEYIKNLQDEEKAAEKASAANKKYIEGISSGLSKITSVATAAQSALFSFGNQIAGFVALANPVAVMRFTQAMQDFQAVIGRALTPVLDRVTTMIRQLGDAFASLSPTAQSLIGGLAMGGGLAGVFAAVSFAVKGLLLAFGPIPLIVGAVTSALAGLLTTSASGAKLMAAFNSVLAAAGTIFEALAGVVLPLVETALELVTPLLEAFASALSYVGSVVREVLSALGLTSAASYNPTAKSSVGAAVRTAGMSDLSSFATKNYTSAYSGSAAAQDVPKESLNKLGEIKISLDNLEQIIYKAAASIVNALGIGKGSAVDAALNPFETGGDGKTNFGRGTDRIMGWMRSVFD